MIVDVHAHLASPESVRDSPMPPSLADVEGMIEAKLAAGITLSIVGSPSGAATMVPRPGMYGSLDQPLDALRGWHDWLAGTVAAHPAHLRAYAYCPPFADDSQLAHVREQLARPEFVGIITNTSIDGAYLDSPRADGFFALADELGVPVLLHPGSEPAATHGVSHYGVLEMVGRHCDVTLGLAMLIASGRLTQYPGITWIAASTGGSISLVAPRLDQAPRPAHWGGGAPDQEAPRPSELLRRIHLDTTADATHWRLASDAVGAGRLMYGTDSPPVPVRFGEHLDRLRLLVPAAELDAVLYGNALKAFRLDALAPTAVSGLTAPED